MLNNPSIYREDVLIHGDYCLPNILLDNFSFTGFIDVGAGGIGDRHHDLLWGIWTLQFNTKSDDYKNRFLDGYGRDKIDQERFKLITAIEAFSY